MIIKLIFENSQVRGEKYVRSEDIDTVTVYKDLEGTIETLKIRFTDGAEFTCSGSDAVESFDNLKNYLGNVKCNPRMMTFITGLNTSNRRK
jgi:hypothetical protein